MRRRPWQSVIVLASLASACVGTSTGNPATEPEIPNMGGPSETAGGGQCDETIVPLASLDAQSSLGFSAADMLALASAQDTSIEWLNTGAGVTYGPENGTGTLRIEVEPRDGAHARFVDRRPKTSGSGGPEIAIGNVEVGGSCADTLELDVRVHVSTGGGALDELLDATLSAKSANVAQTYVQRKAADVTGSFEAHSGSDSSAKLDSLQFNLTFSKLGPSGQLGITFTQPSPAGSGDASSVSSSSVNSGSIARWPANVACASDPISGPSFGARVDQRVDQFSAQDGIERFNAASLQLSAAGTAATGLHVSFTPTSGACAQLEQGPFGPPTAIPSIAISGELTLRSDDGKIDGKWPMQLSAAAADDGSLGAVNVAFDLHGSMIASLVDAAAFESTYGIHGFDMTGYDQAGILLNLSVGPAAAVSGELTVNGVKRPDCQTQAAAPSTPGDNSGASASTAPCAGLQFTAVWTASITAR
jgi:hypothetical protein